MKLYVGNLSYEITEQDLREEFETFGAIDSISIVTDRVSGKPRGFAFVEMSSVSEGRAAVAGINGKTIKERTVVVNEARSRNDNKGGGGYENRGGGSGGRRGSSGYGGGRQRRY